MGFCVLSAINLEFNFVLASIAVHIFSVLNIRSTATRHTYLVISSFNILSVTHDCAVVEAVRTRWRMFKLNKELRFEIP